MDAWVGGGAAFIGGTGFGGAGLEELLGLEETPHLEVSSLEVLGGWKVGLLLCTQFLCLI